MPHGEQAREEEMMAIDLADGRRRGWLVAVLCASFMSINYADKVIVGIAAIPIMEELHLQPKEFGLLGSAFFLLYSVSAIGVGFLADRLSTKLIIASLAAIWALTLFPMATTVSFSVLILCRIVLGAAEGPSIAIANHSIFKWFHDKERARPSAIVSIGSSIGVLVSAPALTYLIRTYNWHVAFGVLAAIGLAWLPIWLLFAKEGPLDSSPVIASNSRSDAPKPPLLPLLTQRTFIGVLACGYTSFSVLALVVAWLPLFLESGEGYSPFATSWLVAAIWVVEAAAVVATGWYSASLASRGVPSRISRGYLAAGLICLSGISLLLAVMLPQAITRIAALVIGFSAAQSVWPLLFALISEIVPIARRASVMSISTAICTTAGLISPALMGYAVQWAGGGGAGYRNGFLILGAFTAIGGVIGLWLINPEFDRSRQKLQNLATPAA
jgi:MFS family permease